MEATAHVEPPTLDDDIHPDLRREQQQQQHSHDDDDPLGQHHHHHHHHPDHDPLAFEPGGSAGDDDNGLIVGGDAFDPSGSGSVVVSGSGGGVVGESVALPYPHPPADFHTSPFDHDAAALLADHHHLGHHHQPLHHHHHHHHQHDHQQQFQADMDAQQQAEFAELLNQHGHGGPSSAEPFDLVDGSGAASAASGGGAGGSGAGGPGGVDDGTGGGGGQGPATVGLDGHGAGGATDIAGPSSTAPAAPAPSRKRKKAAPKASAAKASKLEGGQAADGQEGEEGAPKKLREQVRNACTNCQKTRKKCSGDRPCASCVRHPTENPCVDSTRKKRPVGIKRGKYKTKNRKSGEGTDGADPQSADQPVAGPSTLPHPLHAGDGDGPTASSSAGAPGPHAHHGLDGSHVDVQMGDEHELHLHHHLSHHHHHHQPHDELTHAEDQQQHEDAYSLYTHGAIDPTLEDPMATAGAGSITGAAGTIVAVVRALRGSDGPDDGPTSGGGEGGTSGAPGENSAGGGTSVGRSNGRADDQVAQDGNDDADDADTYMLDERTLQAVVAQHAQAQAEEARAGRGDGGSNGGGGRGQGVDGGQELDPDLLGLSLPSDHLEHPPHSQHPSDSHHTSTRPSPSRDSADRDPSASEGTGGPSSGAEGPQEARRPSTDGPADDASLAFIQQLKDEHQEALRALLGGKAADGRPGESGPSGMSTDGGQVDPDEVYEQIPDDEEDEEEAEEDEYEVIPSHELSAGEEDVEDALA